jgi:hypothetical protein
MRLIMARTTTTRREFMHQALWALGAAAGGSVLTACNRPILRPYRKYRARQVTLPGTEPAPCEPAWDDPPVGWAPNVMRPVFYGYADYNSTVGAPTNVRVYYPSADGAPQCAPFLGGFGRFPLVAFLHGHCPTSESFHYTKWSLLPAVLARCGFVVAVPSLGFDHLPHLDDPAYQRIRDVVDWMRTSWSRRAYLMQAFGVVGHSYGALHGGRLAADLGARAYVSLSGQWKSWPLPSPVTSLSAPKLLAWGTGAPEMAEGDLTGFWSNIGSPKHRLVFTEGQHWDYVPPTVTTCASIAGPCTLVDDLTADLTAIYLSKYMPPEEAGILPGLIEDDLTLPAVSLTSEQQSFAGGHLTSFGRVGAQAACTATLEWLTPDGSGTRTRGIRSRRHRGLSTGSCRDRCGLCAVDLRRHPPYRSGMKRRARSPSGQRRTRTPQDGAPDRRPVHRRAGRVGGADHPAAMHGGKSLRARIRRTGLPETEREMTWPAHERVEIRRSPRNT